MRYGGSGDGNYGGAGQVVAGIASFTGGNTWFVPTGGSSGTGVSAPADTSEDILATINVPALSAGAIWRLWMIVSCTNNTNVKTMRVRFGGIGGTVFTAIPVTSQAGAGFVVGSWNRNATNSQIGLNGNAGGQGSTGLGVTGGAPVTSSLDTSVATTVVITGQKATSGDTLTLEAYVFELLKP